MEFWMKTCLLLCCYGYFKELRPSEPFMTEYLLGPVHNLTESEVYFQMYPVWTYSYLSVLVLVFLVTDLLLYKPVIVLEAVAYIVTYCLLLWARGVRWMQVVEFFYGVVTATEVAYFTYIYAQVSGDRYQQVSSYTRTALLCGKFSAGLLGQVLYTSGLMDAHSLTYVTLAAACVATVFAVLLPPVTHSIYFHREERHGTQAEDKDPAESDRGSRLPGLEEREASVDVGGEFHRLEVEHKSVAKHGSPTEDRAFKGSSKHLPEDVAENRCHEGNSTAPLSPTTHNMTVRKVAGLMWRDFKSAYGDRHVIRWSLWWAAATCGFFQVLNYIQPLWESIAGDASAGYNGAVEAASTLLGAFAAFSVSLLPLSWHGAHQLLLLAVVSLLDGLLLALSGLTNSLLTAYIAYFLFRVSYEFMITVASFQVARSLRTDSYGLVFGLNMFVSLLLQSALTLVVVTTMETEPQQQFVIYGGYFGVLSFVFFVLASYRLGLEGCGGGDAGLGHRTATDLTIDAP